MIFFRKHGLPVVALALALNGCAGRASQTEVRTAENPPAQGEHKSDPMARDFGWITLGVGIAAGTVAVGTSVLMLRESVVRSDNCNEQQVCNADGLEANSRINHLSPPNAVAWVVTAAGIGGGAYLLLTNPKEKKAQTTAVGVSPAGLTLRSTF
jgi:hypothetical protein